MKTKRLKTGDVVLWSGTWGTEKPIEAKVLSIEKTIASHMKEGVEVDSVSWESDFVVVLDNDHWAYSYQLKPLK